MVWPFVPAYVSWCNRRCVWYLQTRSSEISGTITKSSDRGDTTSFMPLLWQFFGPFCRSLRILRSECTISSYPVARLCLFAHVFAHILIVFAQSSAHSLSGRSLCTFTYNFVFLPSSSSDSSDFYDYISSGRVHIFPRWTLAYQVSILQSMPFLYECVNDRALTSFSIYLSIVFSIFFHGVRSR